MYPEPAVLSEIKKNKAQPLWILNGLYAAGERESVYVSATVYVSVSECEIPRYLRVGFAREAFWEAGEEKDVSPHAVRE